jgi:alcohol dehydrogenase class IV
LRQFTYTTTAQQVVFGVGSVARLAQVVAPYGWRRLLLCASPHARRDGTIDRLAAALGDTLAAVYEGVAPHVPEQQVGEAAALAERHGVDAVIGLGGGSPIGMAKAVSLALEARRTGVSQARALHPTEQPLVPSIAIPTTYAGSEMTPVYGVTRSQPDGGTRKTTVRDVKVAPRVVLYDPELTLRLPPDLTASTGINALAHCVEAVYSRTRHPLSTAAALEGIRRIVHALPRCHARAADLEARAEMQEGAHLGGVALATVEMGLHHGTGHVLGGSAGVPHGVANCIALPHAVRFNADAVAPQLALVAEAMGIQRAGRDDRALALAVADTLTALVRQLGQPQRLRDVGVTREQLPALADALLASGAVAANPRPLGDLETARTYLEAMW